MLGVANHLSIDIPLHWDSLRLVSDIAAELRRTNFEILYLRNTSLSNPALGSVRKEASRKAEELRRLESLLSREFVLGRLPSSEELWNHASSISSTSFAGRFFSAACKEAKQCHKTLSKNLEKADWGVMALNFKELAEFQDSLAGFSKNKQYAEAFGDCFDGLATPFNEIAALIQWYADLRMKFSTHQELGDKSLSAFKTLPAETLIRLNDFLSRRYASLDFIGKLEQLLDALPFYADRSYRAKTLPQIIDDITHLSVLLDKIIEYLTDIPFLEHVTLDEMPSLLDRLSALHVNQSRIDNSIEIKALLGVHYRGCSTNTDGLNEVTQLAEAISQEHVPIQLKEWLLTPDFPNRIEYLEQQIQKIDSAMSQFIIAWEELVALTELGLDKWYLGLDGDWRELSLGVIQTRMTRAIEASSCLSEWLAYLRSVREMKEANLAGFIALAETGSLDGCKFTDAYDFSLFHSLSNLILKAHPRLLNFSRTRHERIREEFSSLDLEIQTLYRKRAAHQISRHIVPRGCGTGPIRAYSDLALLNHESQKQRGHISIRSLLNRAGNALMALKPCFMMGPMSVAQYLTPGGFNFDLIVMDEASQLRPEEALGAVARGSQVVIVGDPKQLPPTTFFDSMFFEDISEEDDSLAIEESESILDRACEVYRPIRQLRWHYRSRHESLIAFSNHRFYDRNLILFPSPLKEHSSLGVKRHFIENGVYSGRVNRPEAERVVNAILNHMEQFPKESLGIATFNSAQRDLIEELMDARTKSDLLAQAYLAEWKDSAEPFFIKNLETVQGDERDCMFVSFTYGRDEHGNIYQRFGPINGPTGHRRLNVILTRAKLRTVIFTSMSSEDIKIGDDVSLGVKAMRACLAFSETGILEQPVLGEGQEPNEFEISVKNALSNLGFDVDTQVGVAGYFIDLAIRHPKKSGCYLLGIECDGAPYHSAKSARDRDRLREANLRNLGWDIHRIWSTDWHKNRKPEIERISKYVQQILRKEELPKRN